MSQSVYRISDLLTQILTDVPVGTNLGLLHLQVALLSGRFLAARGAVLPALDALQLDKSAAHRAHAALCSGRCSAGRKRSSKKAALRPTPTKASGLSPVT